ncbi:translation initiation factor SUI1 [Syncephalastrum racemosum]|uniref:Translation machinery-associated protein 22 n=1 Tax=Syncephalastrum racemosum TaxID=13706 RepID=A0A1X2HNJ7_SYNRA|nr:translation initiation factor SUI1 [Syncephalastrum racemosum]
MALEPREVVYCGICTMPVEYCEFSGTQGKCKSWLQKNHEDLYDRIYGDGTVTEKVAQSSRVMVKRVERTKRKCITIVHGLEIFDVDLKKAAKMFANRFACGSSVAKNNQNQDEIVVQGDFSAEVEELILKTWPQVPEDNIDLVEETKKKKSTA